MSTRPSVKTRFALCPGHDEVQKSPAHRPSIRFNLHRPGRLFVAVSVGAVGLRRIAVDQGPQVHRMGGAAHLVLDGEEAPAVGGIDDIGEAVLILVVLARDQAALQQAPVRA